MADEKLGLKYGNWVYNTTDTSKDGNGLPNTINKGTIYIAKTSDGHAQMYVDSPSGERLAIGAAGAGSFFATCSTGSTTVIKEITCPGLSTPINGTMLTVHFTNMFDSSINNIQLKINNTTHNLYNATYGGKSDLGTLAEYVTFIYNGNSNRFEIMDNDGWNRISPVTIFCGKDDVKHYLIATSKSYYDEDIDNPYLGPSGLYVANTNSPYVNSYGNLFIPGGWARVSNGSQYATYGASYINLWDDNKYNYDYIITADPYGFFITENSQYAGTVLGLDYDYWQLYTPYNIYTDGSINAEYDITCTDLYTYGGVSATGSISTAGNLYHKQGVRVPRVWSGTTAPTDDIGENGDIYIMYS